MCTEFSKQPDKQVATVRADEKACTRPSDFEDTANKSSKATRSDEREAVMINMSRDRQGKAGRNNSHGVLCKMDIVQVCKT
jgi:hypothetical protein